MSEKRSIKKYDESFKKTIVDLYQNGKSVRELSREYVTSVNDNLRMYRNDHLRMYKIYHIIIKYSEVFNDYKSKRSYI